jgi:H/ACA ribonucleoprotein complex subunit 4
MKTIKPDFKLTYLLPFEKSKPDIIVKKEAKTDPNLGIDPNKRKTGEILDYGIININKPQGPTSHQVSDYVKKILQSKKSGHSGTLDPNVHGVLPIAIGRATKVVQALLNSGKEYVGIMHLHKNVGENKLRRIIKSHFIGKLLQTPPLKSSVKRVKRQREVYYFDILEKDGQDALFIVGCQAGTYIRKLIHDLGQKLKVGAHMQELRRTKAGPFTEKNQFTLQDLIDAFHYYKQENNDQYLRNIIQPVENAVEHLPKIWVFDSTIDSICHCSDLKIPGICRINDNILIDGMVAILSLKDELVAIGKAILDSKSIIKQDKGIAVITEKVFMEPDTYKT